MTKDVKLAITAEEPLAKVEGSEERGRTLARASVSPGINSALTRMNFLSTGFDIKDLADHAELISERCKEVVDGNLGYAEALLMSQAMTLDGVFNKLAAQAAAKMGENVPAVEAYMRMALKAQAQCAATIRVIGELKNPKSIAFIRQQNNAGGHQQVNNGPVTQPGTSARAREKTPIQSNELLMDDHGTKVDFGAARQASGSDQALEAVGAIDRAENA